MGGDAYAQWKAIDEVDAAFIDKELKQLERLDVPLLHLEAILVYTPEKFGRDHTQRTLKRLTDLGVLTAKTLTRWLEFPLTDTTRRILAAQLVALRSGIALARSPAGRICCPVVIGYQSPLLPGVTLAGVRWVEVVSRGPDAGAASGFLDEWPDRLEELGRRVQDIIRVPLDGRRPHWRLLDSLGQNVIESGDLARGSRSLELGASLACACWAAQLRPRRPVAATGQIAEDRVESIEEPKAKMIGLEREASHVYQVFVAPRDAVACAEAGVSGTGVVPVRSLAEAIETLLALAGDQAREVPRPHPQASKSPIRYWSVLAVASMGLGLSGLLITQNNHVRMSPSADRAPTSVRRSELPRHIDASVLLDHSPSPSIIEQGDGHSLPLLDVPQNTARDSGPMDVRSYAETNGTMDSFQALTDGARAGAATNAPTARCREHIGDLCVVSIRSSIFHGVPTRVSGMYIGTNFPEDGDSSGSEHGFRSLENPRRRTVGGESAAFYCAEESNGASRLCGGVQFLTHVRGDAFSGRMGATPGVLPWYQSVRRTREEHVTQAVMALQIEHHEVSDQSLTVDIRWGEWNDVVGLPFIAVLGPDGDVLYTHTGLLSSVGRSRVVFPRPLRGERFVDLCLLSGDRRFMYCRLLSL